MPHCHNQPPPFFYELHYASQRVIIRDRNRRSLKAENGESGNQFSVHMGDCVVIISWQNFTTWTPHDGREGGTASSSPACHCLGRKYVKNHIRQQNLHKHWAAQRTGVSRWDKSCYSHNEARGDSICQTMKKIYIQVCERRKRMASPCIFRRDSLFSHIRREQLRCWTSREHISPLQKQPHHE